MSKSNNASNKTNNANSIKECKTKICEQFLPMEIKKMSQNISQGLIAKFTKKMNPKEKKEYIDNMNKIKPKQLTKKQLKTEIDSCMHFYCNKG